MKPLWAIQKSCINDIDGSGMVEIIKNLNYPIELLNIIPFDYNNVPDVMYDGPIIPYGGTRLIEQIRQTKKWMCWFNDNFNYKTYLKNFGEYMFNSDAKCMFMKDFCPSNYKRGEYIFIRPNKDLKEFAGSNMKPEDYMNWYRKLQGQGWEIGENTEIVVANASRIDSEWRIYVVDGTPIDGSRYRLDHYQSIVHDVPQRVFDFVSKMIKIWVPSQVFVMDICELDGNLYILEMGDIHACGWYASDKEKIIKAISEFAEKIYI